MVADPRRPDIPARIIYGVPQQGAMEKGATDIRLPPCRNSVRGKAPPCLNFSVQERTIQLLDKLNQLFRILFAAGCFGKYSPISNLGFHWFTSVALHA